MTPDNIFYLILGCIIGYIVAKIEKKVDKIKEEVDEMDSMMKKRDEKGFVDLKSIIVTVLVLATSFSAIFAGVAYSRGNQALNRVDTVTYCSQKLLTDLLISVNERAANTKPLGESNLDLQTSFRNLIKELIHIPPYSDARNFKAVKRFFADQNVYIHKSKSQLKAAAENPLPTIHEYNTCLAEGSHPKGVE